MFTFSDVTQSQKKFLSLAAVSVIAIAGAFSLFPRSHADPIPIAPPIILKSAAPEPTLVVDVAGRVLHPGVYRLPANSRAIDAIKMAGGALKGVSMVDINLAQLLVDGEQILVGAPAVSPVQESKSANSAKSSTAIVNINTATATALQQLQGVGPVMALKIISFRKIHGPFTAISQLESVPGFGKKRFDAISHQLRI